MLPLKEWLEKENSPSYVSPKRCEAFLNAFESVRDGQTRFSVSDILLPLVLRRLSYEIQNTSFEGLLKEAPLTIALSEDLKGQLCGHDKEWILNVPFSSASGNPVDFTFFPKGDYDRVLGKNIVASFFFIPKLDLAMREYLLSNSRSRFGKIYPISLCAAYFE